MKIFRIIPFLLAFIATAEVILMFRTEDLIKKTEAFEPVIIVEQVQEESEPKVETEVEVTETPHIVSDLISRPIPEVENIEPRIDCILDNDTQQMILEKSEQYDVDFAFVMAVIFRESSFRSNVISSDGGDYGLMQINQINHKWLSEELGITNFLDPEQNVTAGLYMLQDLFEKYENPALVLMAYNMGEPTAKKLWNQGIYTSDYAEAILQQTEIYEQEIAEQGVQR